ncbi:MAG: hypothetical protein ACI3XD_06215 [Oscillospiraceae bacterium]
MNRKMLKCLGKAALAGAGGFAALFGVYWFNLDNKLIFYGVRPILNRLYDRQKRDVKL